MSHTQIESLLRGSQKRRWGSRAPPTTDAPTGIVGIPITTQGQGTARPRIHGGLSSGFALHRAVQRVGQFDRDRSHVFLSEKDPGSDLPEAGSHKESRILPKGYDATRMECGVFGRDRLDAAVTCPAQLQNLIVRTNSGPVSPQGRVCL
jgi:hypothetical protein